VTAVNYYQVKVVFAGMDATSQPAGSPHVTLFIHSAEQCFSLTTNQPEQYFPAKFQTSEQGLSNDKFEAP